MSRSDAENCNTTTLPPLPFPLRSTSPPSHSFIFGLPEVSQGRASQCLRELTRGIDAFDKWRSCQKHEWNLETWQKNGNGAIDMDSTRSCGSVRQCFIVLSGYNKLSTEYYDSFSTAKCTEVAMRKHCALDRIGEAIPHIRWTDLTVTKDCQMSKGQERDLSDKGFSVGTESKDRVNLNVFPSQDQTGVVKDYKPASPNHVFNLHLNQTTSLENKSVENKPITFDENSRSLPANMLLISEMESESVGTDVCEVTTKVTNIADISTNDLPEIKIQRQSILKESLLPSSVSVNHTNQETWTENETQVVDVTLRRGSQKCRTLEMDVNAENAQKEILEYCKEFKTKILCHRDVEIFDIGRTMTIASAGDFLGQNDEVEVLDLSLPKKKEKMKERQCEWVGDSQCEGSLLMEVDEIEDDHQHEEVEQEDYYENGWIPKGEAQTYLPQHWDGHLSPNSLIAMSTFTSVPMTPDTLLIDDQGIPYVLTPDGQKVPQIDNIQETEELSKETAPSQAEDNVQDVSESRQNAQPDELGHVSVEASQVVPNLESTTAHSVVLAKSSVSSAVSELASVPIQIMANTTGSNTPILLLSPSQLQTLSSPAFKTNQGLITLSLPVQSTPTSSVFLVLSSPQVSSPQSSSPTEQLCQSSCTSTVALPLAACPLDLGSKLCERPSPLSLDSSTAADISGLNNPSNLPLSPTSSTVSSSTSTVISTSPTMQPCTDAYSMPTSFREALVRLAVSAEKKSESIKTHSVATYSSLSEDSSATVHDIITHETGTNCDDHYPAIETMAASVDQTDTMSTNDISSSSPLRPASPEFPINDSKNQDTQGLGPRRILYCQYCPRIFYYLSDLERHSITHSQNKPHVCQICGKAFKRSSHLERHKHIHTGQRNFVCQLCPRRFRESGELMRHQRVHTGEKPFQCLICHMRFAERNTLRRHTKRKHQGQQQQAMDMNAKTECAGISLVGLQDEPEDNAEWYISTLPEMETDSDTEGE